ncbi:hexose phosphate transporter [[Mycoplasma] mobile]|uniref:Unspecified transport or permease protein n=1 Tax=Mycoplasma mobile (strain ATCC 43663 / 163K / NCTC 11711) TaxID=267748 RepID=Q6KIP7_MYCM1|nr:hexose phosphate transporter [[Mycoplasma] mobile]AAT27529.1 unspecified transport or permease protein [Mycoplasma mobile 163K]
MNIFNFFKSKKNEKFKSKNLTFKQGLLMWSILIIGYIVFIINWLMLGNLAGQGAIDSNGNPIGWTAYFFGGIPENINLITQAVNYTITFMRGVGSLVVGYLIVKLTHKWAVVISLALLLMAIPAILMPSNVGGFAGFIIFRMLLAIGGTTLIIYTQPIVAKSVPQKRKGIFTIFSTFGFSLATIIVAAPFLSLRIQLQTNWQFVSGITAATAFIPLVIYIIFGKNFDITSQVKLDQYDSTLYPTTGKEIIKEKQTWVWVLIYGAGLVLAVIPITDLFRQALVNLAPANLTNQANSAFSIFTIVYVSGVFLSPFTIGLWNSTNAKRKPFAIFIVSMIILAFILMFLGWRFGSVATFYVFGFISGWLVWSLQSITLQNPHERKGNTPKRIGIIFSFSWGFGYFFFTIINIILAAIVPENASLELWIGFVILFLIFSSLLGVGFLFAEETKPQGKIIPGRLKFWKKLDKK